MSFYIFEQRKKAPESSCYCAVLIHLALWRLHIFNLALQNVIKRKQQSFLTIFLTSLSILTLVLVVGIYIHINAGLNLSAKRVGADIILISSRSDLDTDNILFTAGPSRRYVLRKDIEFLKDFPEITEQTYQFFSETLSGGCCSLSEKIRIVGFDSESDFLLKPWLEQNNIDSLADNEVIIGNNMSSIMGYTINLLGEPFEIVGQLYATGSGMDQTIFMNIDKAHELSKKKIPLSVFKKNDMKDVFSSVFVNVKPGTNVKNLADRINASQTEVRAIPKSTSLDYFKEQLHGWSIIVSFLIITLVLNLMIALYGRFNTLARDRRSEAGYLRALGLPKFFVFKLLIAEAWIMAFIGGAVGSILALIFLPSVINVLQNLFTIPTGAIPPLTLLAYFFSGILISLVLVLIASLSPALKTMKMDPQEAMSKGGLE